MLTLFTHLLLKLPPEISHSLVLICLKIYQTAKRILKTSEGPGIFSIKIPPVYEFKVRSRLGLAAGFDKNAEVFPALFHLGFGFVEIGTVTPMPQPGNPRPRIWRVAPQALVNHMGFNSLGLAEVQKNLSKQRGVFTAPVLANIGKNKNTPLEWAVKDYEQSIEGLRNLVDGFVINVSSPNTPGLRELQNEEFLEELAPMLPKDKPTFVKLSPDLTESDFKKLCEFVLHCDQMSGVVLTNTSRKLSEIRGFSQGGLSGPPLFTISLDWIEKAKSIFRSQKIIIGAGGVSSLEDAQEMREAGADLVEVYTAFVYRGPKWLRQITQAF